MRRTMLSLAFLLCCAASASAAPPVPMVDGDCSEYAQPGARHFSAAPGVDLHVFEDQHYVWFCYTYPEGSMGQLDLRLSTPRLAAPLNLHVSAQLGEWPVGRDDLTPKNPDSDLWWNQDGWTGNTIQLNGMDTSGPKPRYRWKNARARELQLAKRRFGSGKWEFSMEIYQVKLGDGLRTVHFPEQGKMQALEVR